MADPLPGRKSSILDFAAVEVLQVLQDSFAEASGVSSTIMDLDGIFVTRPSNTLPLCMEALRAALGSTRCQDSDRRGKQKAIREGKWVVYTCGNGLTDFAAPILDGKTPLAIVYGGQVVSDPADRGRVAAGVARQLLGQTWVDAARAVRVLDRRRIDLAAKVMHGLFNTVVEMGRAQKLELTRKGLLALLNRATSTLTGAQESCLMTYNEQTGKLGVLVGCPRIEQGGKCHGDPGKGLIRKCLEKLETVAERDVQTSGRAQGWKGDPKVQSEIILPLLLHGHPLGLLNLNFWERPDAAVWQEVQEIAALVAAQASLLMEETQMMEAVRENAGRLSIMSEVTTAMADGAHGESSLDPIAKLACRIFGDALCEIWLLDCPYDVASLVAREAGACSRGLAAATISRMDPETKELPLAQSFMGSVAKTRRPLVSPTVAADRRLDRDRARMVGAESLACIPLMDGRDVTGFLTIAVMTRHYFTADEIEFLSMLGRHVVQAVRMHQLRQAEEAVRGVISLSLTAGSLEELAQSVTQDFFQTVFKSSAASLFLVNAVGDRLDLWATTGLDHDPPRRDVWYGLGEGQTGWVWKNKKPLRVPDPVGSVRGLLPPDVHPVVKYSETLPQGTRRQLLAAPLMHGDQVVGVLRMCGRSDGLRYSERDEALAVRLGQELGETVHNFRAIESRQKRLEALSRVGMEIQTLTDPRGVLSVTLSAITCAAGLGFNRAAAWMADPTGRWLEPEMAVGAATRPEALRIWEECKDFSLDQVLSRARETQAARDVPLNTRIQKVRPRLGLPAHDELTQCHHSAAVVRGDGSGPGVPHAAANKPLLRAFGPSRHVIVPLRAGNTSVGVIYVDNAYDGKAIQPGDLAVLSAFAGQAGMAIRNLAVAAEGRDREKLHALFAQSLARAETPEQFPLGVLRSIQEHFGFERLLLYAHHASQQRVVPIGSLGLSEPVVKQISFSTRPRRIRRRGARAIALHVIKTGRAYFAPNVRKDRHVTAHWRRELGLKGPILALPLPPGKSVQGVLVLNGGGVTEAHEGLLGPFLRDLAGAVLAEMRWAEARARDEWVGLLQHIQASFADAVQDEAGFLDGIALDVAGLLKAQLCSIYRPVKDAGASAGEFERRGTFGYPHATKHHRRIATEGDHEGLTNHVLKGRPLNVPNVTGDRRWRGEEEEKLAETIGSKIRAFLGIPGLDSQGRVNVAITLTRARHLLFDGMEFREEEERLVSAITAAVSVVIELKDAREEIELRVKELQAILDAAGEEISVVDPQFVIRFVNKAKRDKFKKDGELVGRKCYKVYEKRPKVCPDCPIKKAMTQARHGDLTPVQSTNHWGCPKGGRAYKAAVTASAIVGPRNKVLGAVELVRDLTQVEEANRRLMQDAARKARQHLTSIRGRTDLLASQWDGASPKWRQCLERHADRLRRLIEQADTYMARWERKPLVARTGSR